MHTWNIPADVIHHQRLKLVQEVLAAWIDLEVAKVARRHPAFSDEVEDLLRFQVYHFQAFDVPAVVKSLIPVGFKRFSSKSHFKKALKQFCMIFINFQIHFKTSNKKISTKMISNKTISNLKLVQT